MSSWIGILALSAVALVIMLLPLWQRRRDEKLGVGIETDEIAKQWEIEKDRLIQEQKDLDLALSEGRISEEAHKVERAEVVEDAERALARLREVKEAQSKNNITGDHEPQVYKLTGLVFGVLMVLATAGLSLHLKGLDVINKTAQNEGQQNISKADIEKMVASLEERVKAGGASQKEQLMLARSYRVMGRTQSSIVLYEKIYNNDNSSLEAIMALGEIYFSSDDKKEQDKALGYFDRALKIYPDKPDALWYKTLSLLRLRKLDEAKVSLVRLRDTAKGNEKVQNAVSQLLAELEKNRARIQE